MLVYQRVFKIPFDKIHVFSPNMCICRDRNPHESDHGKALWAQWSHSRRVVVDIFSELIGLIGIDEKTENKVDWWQVERKIFQWSEAPSDNFSYNFSACNCAMIEWRNWANHWHWKLQDCITQQVMSSKSTTTSSWLWIWMSIQRRPTPVGSHISCCWTPTEFVSWTFTRGVVYSFAIFVIWSIFELY